MLLCGPAPAADKPPSFSKDEIARIAQFGPWPPKRERDASNRVSGKPAAIAWGAQLFFDPRLSRNGKISCATCHDPAQGWAEHRAVTNGIEETERNTRSVVNARFNRWFGWAGATDSLWAASLRPLLDPREMGGVERLLVAQMRSDAGLACGYRNAFGQNLPADDDALFADIGKALAAFQETLVSGRTPFDDFRDALLRGDTRAVASYSAAAQRGLKLFIGEANCSLCHLGPQFTNGEFDKVGISVRHANGRFDWGRYDGIKTLQSGRFNRLSRHNDDAKHANSVSTQHVALDREAYGAFKVPGLRNVALTAPYMHDGSLADLPAVVAFYNAGGIANEGLDSRLKPLGLDATEQADLVAFLRSLTGSTVPTLVRDAWAAPIGDRQRH